MAFDPTLPANLSVIDAEELRNQFNALKALIDALPAGPPGPAGATGATGAAGAPGISMPIGGACAWMKNLSGVPALGSEFAECNGQVLNDMASPLNGITLPDLNSAQRFLRGASASGGTGGADSHTHTMQDLDSDHGHFNSVSTSSNDVSALAPGSYLTDNGSSLPGYYEVVWVMRVK